MATKPIRVLIIDDSPFFRDLMARTLSMDLSTEVVAAVGNPAEVPEAVRAHTPNIITLDIAIQGIVYRDFIRKLRADFPHIPIIVISPMNSNVFDALKAGAVDFVSKPDPQQKLDNAAFIREVTAKIKTVYSGASGAFSSSARQSRAYAPPAQPASRPPAAAPAVAKPPVIPSGFSFGKLSPQRMIAIGASTGGTEAILAVVRGLPANTPGVVIVQHMPPVFTRMFAERLDKACRMTVREAQNGDRVQQGLVLVAEGSQQLRVVKDTRGYYVKLEQGEKVSGHCPSVDVLFESVASAAGANAVGIILTGMGGDGAKNLLKMREAGAYTIGQDEASCVVYGMPMVAYNLGAVVDQLPLDAISGAIIRYLSK